jgi:hypothetical protein
MLGCGQAEGVSGGCATGVAVTLTLRLGERGPDSVAFLMCVQCIKQSYVVG